MYFWAPSEQNNYDFIVKLFEKVLDKRGLSQKLPKLAPVNKRLLILQQVQFLNFFWMNLYCKLSTFFKKQTLVKHSIL